MGHVPQGIVEQSDEGYVGYCYEVGVTVQGQTLEETFDNLRLATWQAFDDESTGGEPAMDDVVVYHMPLGGDETAFALDAVTVALLDGIACHAEHHEGR